MSPARTVPDTSRSTCRPHRFHRSTPTSIRPSSTPLCGRYVRTARASRAPRVFTNPSPARLRARDVLRTRTRTPVRTVFPPRIESPRAVRHFPGTSETSTRRRVDAPSPSTGLRITKSTPPRRRARRVHPARRAIPETSPPSLSIRVVGARTRVRYTSSRVHHRSRASAASAAATRRARAAIEVPRADRARAGTPSSRNLVAWTRLYGVRSVGLHT